VRKALDTNVLVRALVHDSSRQCDIALSLLADGPVHIPLTVMLETEWVLRSHFELGRKTVNSLMISFLSRDNIEVEQRETVENAVLAHQKGWDFADALHVFAASGVAAFLTFDRKLVKFAAKHGSPIPINIPTFSKVRKAS
jgi:predicted nucleic-acid-binding protein